MVRHGHSDFTERRSNKNITATAVTAFSLTGVEGEPDKGRKPLPFRSPSEMIRENAADPKPRHNFSLPRLRCGRQISMRCMKAADHSTSAFSSSSISADLLQSVQRSFNQKIFEEDGEGIEAVREKLMLDLKMETDKIRKELLKEDGNDRVESARAAEVLKEGEFGGALTEVTATPQSKDGGAEMRPWNLRTRRAVCTAQAAKNGSPARREGGATGKERERFSLVLKRKEIEEDFMMLTGRHPSRRPKKRLRAVRKQLDMLFPGSWLTEITAGAYKVVELPDDGEQKGLRSRKESKPWLIRGEKI